MQKTKKRKLYWLMLPVALLVLLGCANALHKDSVTQISAAEAVAMMENGDDYIILDVRTEAEYRESHIPGAICLPNESIGAGISSVLPDKEQTILVYCRSGKRSSAAAQKLAEQGYTHVYDFGGIVTWQGATVSGSL